MQVLLHDGTDPFFNEAMEEYLCGIEREDDLLVLWRNQPSIILGKYQNIYEELDLIAAYDAKLPVVRRCSGGGTVFHDMGNLNYAIHKRVEKEEEVEYDSFLLPVIDCLRRMGYPANKRNSSDIVLHDKKISGSAQRRTKRSILHHGTLLFNSDLEDLRAFLRPTDAKLSSKAVASTRSKVTNLSEMDGAPHSDILEFRLAFASEYAPDATYVALGEEDVAAIAKLQREQYESFEWNYGVSPKCEVQKESVLEGSAVHMDAKIAKGKITELTLTGSHPLLAQWSEALLNRNYEVGEVHSVLARYVNDDDAWNACRIFF